MLQSPRWSQAAGATASATAMTSIVGCLVLGGDISVCSGQQLPAHRHQPLRALGAHQAGPSWLYREGAPTSCHPTSCSHSHPPPGLPREETSRVPSAGSHSPLLPAPSPPRTSPLCPWRLLSPGDTFTSPAPHILQPLLLRPSSPSLLCFTDPEDLMSKAAPLQAPLPLASPTLRLGATEPPLLPELLVSPDSLLSLRVQQPGVHPHVAM